MEIEGAVPAGVDLLAQTFKLVYSCACVCEAVKSVLAHR